MLDLPPEGCWEVKWAQVHEMFKHERFFKIAVKGAGHDQANTDIEQWGKDTWRVLEEFGKYGSYGSLSQRTLKFYSELQKAAAVCALTRLESGPGKHLRCRVKHEKWKAGYNLIVNRCAPGRHSHALPDLLYFFPFSCLGRWMRSWSTL